MEETNQNIKVANDSVESEEILDELDDTEMDQPDKIDLKNVKNDIDVKKIECGEFINTDLVPVKAIKCIVPSKLLDSIRKIESSVKKKLGDKEFSIYIHGDYDSNGNLVVSENFYIPRQNVGAASVDYLEDPEPYYNGCLHKHPDGCKNFSGVDEKYINSNFDFSLLYVCLKISKGIINILYDGVHRIQCSVNVQIDTDNIDNDINIDNIIMKSNVVKPNECATRVPGLLMPGFSNENEKCKEVVMPHVVNYPTVDPLDEIGFNDPEQMEFFNKWGGGL